MAPLRRSFALLGLTALLCCPPSWAQTAPSPSWSTYRNEAFDFAIDTPGPPPVTVTTTATAVGPMPTLQATIDLGPRGALQITAMDLSQLQISSTVDQLLEGGVQGALNAVGAVKDAETTIAKGTAVGREFTAHNQDAIFKAREYYSQGHIVAIIGVAPAGSDIPADWERAESSLEFLH